MGEASNVSEETSHLQLRPQCSEKTPFCMSYRLADFGPAVQIDDEHDMEFVYKGLSNAR